jgi:prepilin-type N-terminal cleavage/methylation domain-containing protein
VLRTPSLRPERGFTLVELLVAIFVLLVGLLGVVAMIDHANATTSRTKSREGATALGRTVVEISRGIPYEDLDGTNVIATLQSKSGLEDTDTGTSGHQIDSRNFRYTVAVTTCSLDDPRDGFGTHDAPVVYCPDTDTLPVGDPARDRNPDDYKRVIVEATWRMGQGTSTRTTRQTGLIPNPVGGLGPSIVDLAPTSPNSLVLTAANTPTGTASYRATTSRTPAEVSWSLNGSRQGNATGAGTVWDFTWDLEATRADGSLKFPDCTYIVEAEAFDDKGRAGAPRAITVTVNRKRPATPSDFAGGRNVNGNNVDLEWAPNPECDILGYRVYRGVGGGPINTLVCPASGSYLNAASCVDETAPDPSAGTLQYELVAVDKDENNNVLEGTRTSPITIVEGNSAPTTPTNLVGCIGGTPGCNDIDGNPAGSGSPVLSWDPATDPGGVSSGIFFYRIYRDGNTYADRYHVFFPASGKPLVWLDSRPGAGGHSYRVSAVDTLYGESVLTSPVTP